MNKRYLKRLWRGFLFDVDKTETQVADELNTSPQNINNKINKGTMRLLEFWDILDKNGYTIKIEKK